jgi:hypothetical protein
MRLNVMLLNLLIVLTLAFPTLALADYMRCGNALVNEETPPAELLKKCGEPRRKEVATEDSYAVNPAGYRFKAGVVTTERWYYQPDARSLPMVVTIVDGKTRSIRRVE